MYDYYGRKSLKLPRQIFNLMTISFCILFSVMAIIAWYSGPGAILGFGLLWLVVSSSGIQPLVRQRSISGWVTWAVMCLGLLALGCALLYAISRLQA